MQQRISPASALTGSITLPGDKSISHRYAMIASLAEGDTRIANYSTGADCHSTLECMRALGIEIEGQGTEFVIHGKGLDGLRAATRDLDAGNSGSTIRMLAGILAAQKFTTRIGGEGEPLAKASVPRTPLKSVSRCQSCISFITERNLSGSFSHAFPHFGHRTALGEVVLQGVPQSAHL